MVVVRPLVAQMLRQIAAGVACMHNADIQHCDLKPDNIFIGRDGDVRIADFGQ
jgi:serine/threonine protein kinase